MVMVFFYKSQHFIKTLAFEVLLDFTLCLMPDFNHAMRIESARKIFGLELFVFSGFIRAIASKSRMDTGFLWFGTTKIYIEISETMDSLASVHFYPSLKNWDEFTPLEFWQWNINLWKGMICYCSFRHSISLDQDSLDQKLHFKISALIFQVKFLCKFSLTWFSHTILYLQCTWNKMFQMVLNQTQTSRNFRYSPFSFIQFHLLVAQE